MTSKYDELLHTNLHKFFEKLQINYFIKRQANHVFDFFLGSPKLSEVPSSRHAVHALVCVVVGKIRCDFLCSQRRIWGLHVECG